MNQEIYRSLSARGRVAYAILCAENFALDKKPEANWSPLFAKLWEVLSNVYWDEWSWEFTDMIPEYLTEFPNYEESGFEYLTEPVYDKLLKLYEGMPAGWNSLLSDLNRLVLVLGHDCDDPEEEAADLIPAIEDILSTEGVSLPTENLADLFPASENRGYGNPFDGRNISRVLH